VNVKLVDVVAVALNYQTCGLMMDLSDGRFMQNGSCGYVLKPAVMRDEIAYFRAGTRDIIPGISPQILHIKVRIAVVSGSFHFLRCSMDPYHAVNICFGSFGISYHSSHHSIMVILRNSFFGSRNVRQ